MEAKAAFYFLILCRQLLSLERYHRKKLRSIAELRAFYGIYWRLFFIFSPAWWWRRVPIPNTHSCWWCPPLLLGVVGEGGSRGEPRHRSEGTPSSLHTPLSSLSPPGTGPILIILIIISVRDPEPDPQDLQVFGLPRSGSISQRYGSGSVRLKIIFLRVSYKKKLWKN
jgi:hypothetical protein